MAIKSQWIIRMQQKHTTQCPTTPSHHAESRSVQVYVRERKQGIAEGLCLLVTTVTSTHRHISEQLPFRQIRGAGAADVWCSAPTFAGASAGALADGGFSLMAGWRSNHSDERQSPALRGETKV